MSRKNALKPLSHRLNPYQSARREQRMSNRAMRREVMVQNISRLIGMATEPLRRGFFGRLKWLVFGR